MYEIQILRVNSMGGVTRGRRRASNHKELMYWIEAITGPSQSDTLIEFTVRTTADNEDG
jgi:hypothetical protein